METPRAERPRRRWARLLAGVLLSLVAPVALVLIVALVLVHNLDRPWLKSHVVSQVESATGIQVDYQTTQVSLLSGLRLEGLVVRTPAAFQRVAPELLRVGTLEVKWSPGSLTSGGTLIEHVAAREVTVALVADDAGPTSLSELTGPPAPAPVPEEPSLGLSRQLASLLASAPPVARVDVSGVSLAWLRVQDGVVVDRWSVRGLGLGAEVKEQDGAWKLFANLGRTGAPLPLELGREGTLAPAARAELALALAVEAGATAARARVDLDVARQTFDPRFSVNSLLHGAVSARFDAEARRTLLELERTGLTDSAELQAELVLPDDSSVAPVVTRALADVDLAKLLRVLPEDWRPFTLERGEVRLDARDVTLGAIPLLGAEGKLGLDVELTSLRLAQDGLTVALGDGRVSLAATPDARQGVSALLTFALQKLEVDGPATVRVPKAQGELKGQQLRPEPSSPLQVAGDAALSGLVEAVDVKVPGLRAKAQRLGFQLQAPLAGKPPFSLRADLPVEALEVVTAQGLEVLKGPVHVKLDASQVVPHVDAPRLTRARGRLVLDVGAMHATLDATKGADDVAYTLAFETPDLVAARPFIPNDVAARIPWKQLGVGVSSQGKATALFSAAPRVDHRTEVRVRKPGWDDVSAGNVTIVARSQGDAWRHKGEVELRVDGLRVGETDGGPQRHTFTVDLDRRKPTVKVGVTSQEGVKATVDVALAYERKTRALQGDVKADLPPLGRLAPLLALAQVPRELNASRLGVKLDVNGTLLGVVTGLTPDGLPRFSPEPLRTGSFAGKAVVDVQGFRWRQDALTVNLPGLHWAVDSHVDGPKRTIHSDMTVEKLTVAMADSRLSLADLSSDTTATFTDKLEAEDIEVTQQLTVRSVEQKPALPYPVRDLAWAFTARRKPTGVIHVPELKVTNGGTSTELSIKGRLDLGEERRRLGLRGELSQDLSKLARPGVLESSGHVKVDFRVASPDLTLFRTRANLLLQNVNARMPEADFAVEALDGNVPLSEDVLYTDGQVRLSSDIDVNPYPMLRFADQHPLLSRSGYVSANSITTPFVTIAPLAGNLSIDQHVVSMTQLEMGVRGGRITGQWLLDWQGKDSKLEARVRATGVQSSRGEPFDGNAAVVISAKDRSINGRAEILRIGNRHLLDLLDLEDPRHVDPATNRVRYALTLGYPDHVRVSFNHGFGSLRITMGGLAKLISINEIRGIPMGPIVDQLIKSMTLTEASP
ncbi:hypothetical protein [Myxococcus fulvus]|uniref:hypothetical protein n=1 Tax=Myxococcus fulvus TaxID=33 RepID=UPI0020BFDB83|nr:hypothetical protein [Myxococcus fulvus]MCK8503956.1 hypothetical protein [Myxococcus fulvus]